MLNGLMKSNGWFPTMFDDFFNTDFMPRANNTAPAVNVKESEKAYTMELAAPGIKKEYCRVGINDEGNTTNYFTRYVKRVLGMTPSQYKAKFSVKK